PAPRPAARTRPAARARSGRRRPRRARPARRGERGPRARTPRPRAGRPRPGPWRTTAPAATRRRPRRCRSRPGRARSWQHTPLFEHPDERGHGVRPGAEDGGLLPLGRGHPERPLAQPFLLPLRLGTPGLRPLGPPPPPQRRVAGQVDPLLDADHRGQPELERLLAAAVLSPGPGTGPGLGLGDLQVLDAGDTRPAQGAGHPETHLIVAGVGRLVAA